MLKIYKILQNAIIIYHFSESFPRAQISTHQIQPQFLGEQSCKLSLTSSIHPLLNEVQKDIKTLRSFLAKFKQDFEVFYQTSSVTKVCSQLDFHKFPLYPRNILELIYLRNTNRLLHFVHTNTRSTPRQSIIQHAKISAISKIHIAASYTAFTGFIKLCFTYIESRTSSSKVFHENLI